MKIVSDSAHFNAKMLDEMYSAPQHLDYVRRRLQREVTREAEKHGRISSMQVRLSVEVFVDEEFLG